MRLIPNSVPSSVYLSYPHHDVSAAAFVVDAAVVADVVSVGVVDRGSNQDVEVMDPTLRYLRTGQCALRA